MKHPVVLLLILAIFAFSGFGCSPIEPVQFTRTEISEKALTVQMRRDDAGAMIEIRRGGPRVPRFIRDPEVDSPFEADLLLSDRYAQPMIVSFGGDAALVQEWTERIDTSAMQVDGQERKDDLQLVIDGVDQLLQDPRLFEQFRWELQDVQNAARGSLSEFDVAIPIEETPPLDEIQLQSIQPVEPVPEQTMNPRPPQGEGSALDGYGQTSSALTTTYVHRVRIRWKNCCVIFGHHSAVKVTTLDSTGTIVIFSLITNNHGAPADDPGMTDSLWCPRQWGGRTNRVPMIQPYASTDVITNFAGTLFDQLNAGGCGTPYGLTAGTHVCNDDSVAEYVDAKYNAVINHPTCSDATLQRTAPTCN